MKQVKLTIEKCSLNDVLDHYYSENPGGYLVSEIEDIICSHCYVYEELLRKTYESRETIIKALEEYQKSRLPDDYRLKDNKILKLVGSEDFMTPEYEKIATFYDTDTRIICVTDFEQEADQ